ncbi:TetR/AcrR family transcriptional regulator [Radicibacter daui]|uniref:TetR/AcrR family transcriptional regulator n=1 Tax=Radicibacter daui TaxID=3064829 RepID=UPI0040468A70
MAACLRNLISAVPRSGRPPRDVADELPALILDVAEALFIEHGYAATSMQMIATRAGATKRTLYVKVGDKRALFEAVIRRVLAGGQEISRGHDPAAPAAETLEKVARLMLAVALNPVFIGLRRVVIAEAMRFPELAALMEERTAQGMRPRLALLLSAMAVARGEAPRDEGLNASFLFDMIIAEPLRRATYCLPALSPADMDQRIAAAIALFLKARPLPDLRPAFAHQGAPEDGR